MFENMLTMIIMMILIFLFSSVAVTEMETLNARKIHASAITSLESSYFTISEEQLNEQLHEKYPSWKFTLEDLSGSARTGEKAIVRLHYSIIVPVLGIKRSAVLEGYAG